MKKTLFTFISTVTISLLMTLSLASCQKEPDPTDGILTKSVTSLELPTESEKRYYDSYTALPRTMETDGYLVDLKWEVVDNKANASIKNYLLKTSADLKDLDIKLKCTLSFNKASKTKDFTISVPQVKELSLIWQMQMVIKVKIDTKEKKLIPLGSVEQKPLSIRNLDIVNKTIEIQSDESSQSFEKYQYKITNDILSLYLAEGINAKKWVMSRGYFNSVKTNISNINITEPTEPNDIWSINFNDNGTSYNLTSNDDTLLKFNEEKGADTIEWTVSIAEDLKSITLINTKTKVAYKFEFTPKQFYEIERTFG